MQYFLQNLFNSLQLGSFYALIALGYSMVYGVLMLFNFAHGDVFMVGAYIGFFVSTSLLTLNLAGVLGFPPGIEMGLVLVLTLIMAMFLNTLVGMLVERIGYRPLTRSATSLRRDYRLDDRHHPRDRESGFIGRK